MVKIVDTPTSGHAGGASSRVRPPGAGRFPGAVAGTVLGGAWALGDQAVLSLGNFLTNLALIRHLRPEVYGAYALVFGTLLFLVSLHAAVVVYPLSLKGAAADGTDAIRGLTASALGITAALWVPLAAGLVAAVLLLRRPDLVPWAAAALLLWLVQETLRRALLARLRHRDALLGDAISYLGQAAVVWILARRGTLSIHSALAAVAVTSAAGAVVQAAQLGLRKWEGRALRPVAAEFWSHGRWMLLVNLTGFVTILAMPWTLKFFHGNDEVARFQSLAVLLGVGNPVTMGIVGLIVPAVAAASRGGGPPAGKSAALRYAAVGAALLLPYYVLLTLAPTKALSLFFGADSAYVGLATPLRLFVAAYAMSYAAQVSAALLNGLGRSRWAFVAHGVGAAATVAVSLPLAAALGLTGAVWGGLLPAAGHVVASLLLINRLTPSERTPGAGGALLQPT